MEDNKPQPSIETPATDRVRLTMNLIFSEVTAKAIFDHVRNLLTSSFLLVLGLFAHSKEELYAGSINFAGITFIILSCFLILLNLIDGIRRLKKLEHHYALITMLIVLYVAISFRVIVIAIDFRSSLVS